MIGSGIGRKKFLLSAASEKSPAIPFINALHQAGLLAISSRQAEVIRLLSRR